MHGMIPVLMERTLRPPRHVLAGRRVLVVSDGDGLAAQVQAQLTACGAVAEVLSVREAAAAHASRYEGDVVDAGELARRLAGGGPCPDWVFFLAGYTARAERGRPFDPAGGMYAAGLMRTLFNMLSPLGRQWVDRGAGGFAVVTKADGRFGLTGARSIDPIVGALHGLTRAVHCEIPQIRTAVLDVAPSVPLTTVAERLLDLASDDERDHAELGLTGQLAFGTTLVPTFEQPSAVPGADGDLPLDRGSTVLATGGGRGVTAQVVRMMAAQVPCRYVLLGTTALVDVRAALGVSDRDYLLNMTPGQLDEHRIRHFTAMRRDDSSLLPPAFERHWAKITNSLEVMRTLAHIRDLGAQADYVRLDITDAHRTRRYCQEMLNTTGPVDALLHGAGVETSNALCAKTQESWERTAAVKVKGLYNISPLLGDTTRLVMLFGSAAGTFGSPGQIDYAGASEFLTTAAHRLAGELPAARVRSVAWPPWDEVGMAVRPSSRLILEKRGFEFMKVAEGVAWAEALMRSPSRVPTGLTLGCPGMPEQATSNRTISPWGSTSIVDHRLVDTCHLMAPSRWELRWTYQPELDAALRDHQVKGAVRVPIAFFIELICQAVDACHGVSGGFVVRDLRMRGALALAPGRCRELCVTVEGTSETTSHVTIRSSPVLPDNTWAPALIEHVRTDVDTGVPVRTNARAELGQVISERLPVDGVYERFAANRIVYGPAFREIVSCHRYASRRQVQLRARPVWNEDARGRSFFNIGLVDLALQSLCFNPRTHGGGLPTGVGKLTVHARFGEACSKGWAVVDTEDEQLNVTLTDSAGRVLLEIHNLELTPLKDA